MSGESVVVISTQTMSTEAVYVTTYYALYEVACKRLHKG
jgi:hypothetical protein